MGSRRRGTALAVTLVAALALLAIGGCTTPASTGGTKAEPKTPYKLGVVVSLTGTYAGLGTPEKAAIELEMKRVNDAGGVNGHPVEVIFEDDGTDVAKALAATSRLVTRDRVVAVIGATGTGQTMGMRAEIDKAKVPQVSMAGGTVITSQFDPLVFQTPWSNTLVVPFELKYLQGKGITKVGLITDSGGFGKDGLAVLQAELPKFGMSALASETFNPGDTDMTSQLTKIRGAGVEAVILWNAGTESAIVAKNMKQLGMRMPLIGSHGNARMEFITGAGPAAEGFTFAAGKILKPEEYGTSTEAYKVAEDFITRFTEATGAAPDTFAGHAYDAFNITVEAMKRLPEGFTPADLRDEIEKTKGFIGIGGTFTYSATDHNGMSEKDLVMYKVENGSWTVAK